MDHVGNVLLKLENSTTGGANWEQMLTNDSVNTWNELCFDVSLPSSADPFEPAAGQIYQTVTIFFDFGLTGAESAATSYFDDVVTCETGGATSADVDFAVDMNNYSGNFSTVFVSEYFKVSYQTAKNNIASLIKLGVLKKVQGRKRNKLYFAEEVLDIINRPFQQI